MTEIHGDKLRGHLETMILAVLEKGDAHGLEILQRLDQAGCGLLKLKEGSLYPALYRLEEAGKVTVVKRESQQGRRGAPKRIYRLTTKGKKSLSAGRSEWREFVDVIGGILAVERAFA